MNEEDYAFDDEFVGDAADEFLKQAESAGNDGDGDNDGDGAGDATATADVGVTEDELANISADGQLAWLETYFVLFERDARPTLTQVEAAIHDADSGLRIENLRADDDGLFRSVMVQAPEDNAALEITFEAGDAVSEQSTELAKSLQKDLDGDQLARLLRADARLDVMHFERLRASNAEFRFVDGGEGLGDLGDEPPDDAFGMEGLDPASLITVVEALANLTDGLPVDPAAGEVLL